MNTYTNLTNICDDLEANGVAPKVTKLKSNIGRRRKSLLNKTNSSGRSGLGSHDTTKGSYVGKGDIAIGAGRMGTLNPVNSLGRDYKGDKGRVKATYDAQVKADRKAAALDRRG